MKSPFFLSAVTKLITTVDDAEAAHVKPEFATIFTRSSIQCEAKIQGFIVLLLSSPSRLCVCDMDRLGRNEFIGEVRVALKKLREGENKRYNMGLERIAQV